MKYIPDSVVLRQSPAPHGQFYDLRLVKYRRENAVICTKLSENLRPMFIKLLFFSLRESYIQSLQKRIHHPRRKRRQKKQTTTTTKHYF